MTWILYQTLILLKKKKKSIVKYHNVIKRLNSVGLACTSMIHFAAQERICWGFDTATVLSHHFVSQMSWRRRQRSPKHQKKLADLLRVTFDDRKSPKGSGKTPDRQVGNSVCARARGLKRKVAAVRANSKRRKRRKSSSWKGLQIRRDPEVQEVPHPCSPGGDHGPNPCHFAFPKVVIWVALNWG